MGNVDKFQNYSRCYFYTKHVSPQITACINLGQKFSLFYAENIFLCNISAELSR